VADLNEQTETEFDYCGEPMNEARMEDVHVSWTEYYVHAYGCDVVHVVAASETDTETEFFSVRSSHCERARERESARARERESERARKPESERARE